MAPVATAEDAARLGRFTDWLARDGRFLPGNGELLAAFCERVVASGVPLARASMHLRALHPQYGGISRIWRRGAALEERFLDHGIEKTATYVESPVRAVVEGGERLGWRLDGNAGLPFPVLEEFRAEGYVEYAIAPLVYTDGAVNAISWATDRAGGFGAGDLDFLDAVLPSFASTVELKSLRRFTSNLLVTYVGREPGQLILSGQIRRGDVRAITAALMLIDLRDFTSLSDTLSPRAVIRMLNAYFDCVMPPMRRHGGEVMEIMGDAVLAIFRDGPESARAAACGLALAAASEGLAALAEANERRHPGLPKLHAGVALHYGTVSYGNIGAEDRLDFTVIGPDVNLTSRIERLCRELDRDLIMSEAFATSLDRPTFEIGHFQLRGFSRMQRLFELPPPTG